MIGRKKNQKKMATPREEEEEVCSESSFQSPEQEACNPEIIAHDNDESDDVLPQESAKPPCTHESTRDADEEQTTLINVMTVAEEQQQEEEDIQQGEESMVDALREEETMMLSNYFMNSASSPSSWILTFVVALFGLSCSYYIFEQARALSHKTPLHSESYVQPMHLSQNTAAPVFRNFDDFGAMGFQPEEEEEGEALTEGKRNFLQDHNVDDDATDVDGDHDASTFPVRRNLLKDEIPSDANDDKEDEQGGNYSIYKRVSNASKYITHKSPA